MVLLHRSRSVAVAAAAAALLASGCATPERTDSISPSLRSAARGKFAMGVGISDRIPERPADWALLTNQFDIITPENCLKPDPVQVAEGRFEFARPDAFVDFASAHGLKVVGHCLV
jgi:GH35 family endo-1,4-beta-xylanase